MTRPRAPWSVWMRSAVVATALVVVSACSGGDNTPATTTTEAPATSSSAVTSTAPATAERLTDVAITLTEIATVDQPTALATRAGDTALYVTEQTGKVRKLTARRSSGGAVTYRVERAAVVDVTGDITAGGERGLLGITFSRDGRRLYLAYTGTDEKQHVDEWQLSGDRVDLASRRSIFVVDDFAPNHNGGSLAIGPDGYLYYGMGDGGGAGDPRDTGQNANDLLGAIMRVDPEGGDPYAIPPNNPFAGGGGAPEVWAFGLRNPWRFSFDRTTGDLWIADVGQGDWEEINFLPVASGGGSGANLGWSELEGTHPYRGGRQPSGAVAPIFEYDHGSGGCSVTGGFVYRGTRIAPLAGAYVFADFCAGEVRALVQHEGAVVEERTLGAETPSISSFGQDGDGELYVLSLEGSVYRIDPG